MKFVKSLSLFLWRTFVILIIPSILAIATGLLSINFYYTFTDSSLGIDNIDKMINHFVGYPTFVLLFFMIYFIGCYWYIKKHTKKSRF